MSPRHCLDYFYVALLSFFYYVSIRSRKNSEYRSPSSSSPRIQHSCFTGNADFLRKRLPKWLWKGSTWSRKRTWCTSKRRMSRNRTYSNRIWCNRYRQCRMYPTSCRWSSPDTSSEIIKKPPSWEVFFWEGENSSKKLLTREVDFIECLCLKKVLFIRGCSSMARVSAFQADCCGFESHRPLHIENS